MTCMFYKQQNLREIDLAFKIVSVFPNRIRIILIERISPRLGLLSIPENLKIEIKNKNCTPIWAERLNTSTVVNKHLSHKSHKLFLRFKD